MCWKPGRRGDDGMSSRASGAKVILWAAVVGLSGSALADGGSESAPASGGVKGARHKK